MDAELQKWVDSELAKCYRRYQDTETWPKCYYLVRIIRAHRSIIHPRYSLCFRFLAGSTTEFRSAHDTHDSWATSPTSALIDFYLLTFLFLVSLDVSYRWRKEEILVQSIEYSGSVLRHRANTEYGSQYAVYNADFYCLNYIDQLRRIKPYDMAGCITVLQWYVSCHRQVIRLLR